MLFRSTPRTTVERINADIVAAVATPVLQERLAAMTVDVATGTPAAFDEFIRAEIAGWGQVVRNTGVRID